MRLAVSKGANFFPKISGADRAAGRCPMPTPTGYAPAFSAIEQKGNEAINSANAAAERIQKQLN